MATTDTKRVKIITWNINGLDDQNLTARMEEICKIIKRELPDVVHLQEVIMDTLNHLQHHLPEYRCISSMTSRSLSFFFNVSFLREDSATYESHKLINYTDSPNSGTIIAVKARVGADVPATFLNAHFENEARLTVERKHQLQQTLNVIREEEPDRLVVLAGNLNLREKELTDFWKEMIILEDGWELFANRQAASGVRTRTKLLPPAVRYTVAGNQRFNARCRFDRIFARENEARPLSVTRWEYVGVEEIGECMCPPSGHWGQLCQMELR